MFSLLSRIRKLNTTALLTGVFILGASLHAQSYNIDLGSHYTEPPNSFGGSANQPGVWNRVDTTGTTALVDLNNLSAGATVEVLVPDGGLYGFYGNEVISDQDLLQSDRFNSPSSAAWSIEVFGLSNGLYDIYVYSSLSTGTFTLQGQPADAISGYSPASLGHGSAGSPTFGLFENIAVTDGSLSFFQTNTELSGFTSVAGLQIVAASAVPEPSSYAALAGLAVMGFVAQRRRGRRETYPAA
ncbi:PEP-CTERM sorting domain-containing protein [Synoicihabitans lomoniglobus]|uniref:PEP-CTERM sorting domain-containing protein n=1 Tax=Synoicihabitans lomoniglobus TaxID=2909285 RepID=A0AAF0CPW6_9BACT|nr:PEP-CTERM sorting domain-containing protein [Opitutaceae bacterium LMO-M01]WED65891.1 PEP-CTERM sorting domain-containing protein [Opitutaceae bacterium LMO-M01]